MWHVIYESHDGQVQSRVARTRDLAIQMACELLQSGHVVRRAIGPNELTIEHDELHEHYDDGRFPGLHR